MPALSAFPPETLLAIFESAVDSIPGYLDLDALQCSYERNATLAACALVCRDWAVPAQKVFFRDIALGVTADDVADDSEEQDENVRYRPGRTSPALHSLISTLETLRDNGSAIPHNVRALHLCVGHTAPTYLTPDLEVDHVVHGPPSDIMRLVSLCAGLVHLSFIVGVYNEDDENITAFTSDELAIVSAAHLPNLRHLSVGKEDDEDFISSFGYDWPASTMAHQIIAALAPRITLLDVDIRAGDGDEDEALPELPELRTLHGTSWTSRLREAIWARAPSLRRVSLSWVTADEKLREFIPHTIRELCMGYLRDEDDISRFEQLEVLEILDLPRVAPSLLQGLHKLPLSLRKLCCLPRPQRWRAWRTRSQTLCAGFRVLNPLRSYSNRTLRLLSSRFSPFQCTY